MNYYYDDGKSKDYIQLIVSHIDSDGDTIFKKADSNEVVIPAAEYLFNLLEEMAASGDDFGQCVERVRNVYSEAYATFDVVYEQPTDDEIVTHFLDDFNANAEDNDREEMSIEDVRSAF
jgi:hypothetical protein